MISCGVVTVYELSENKNYFSASEVVKLLSVYIARVLCMAKYGVILSCVWCMS